MLRKTMLFTVLVAALGATTAGPALADARSDDSDSTYTYPYTGTGKWTYSITTRVSVDSAEAQANDDSGTYFHYRSSVSADGRYIAFVSSASNLVPNDTNWAADVFVRDTVDGTTERVSEKTRPTFIYRGWDPNANGTSAWPSISADGRYVAFHSSATNLGPDINGQNTDVFVRDRQTDTTHLVSVNSDGDASIVCSLYPSISSDGRFVAFVSTGPLTPNDFNGVADVFVRDLLLGTTTRASLRTGGKEADSPNSYGVNEPSISADGRFVAYHTHQQMTSQDNDAEADVYITDRDPDQDGNFEEPSTYVTELVSVGSNGKSNNASWAPDVSDDGSRIAFMSLANNLVGADANPGWDVFVRDRSTGTTILASVDGSGNQITQDYSGQPGAGRPKISGSGNRVAFAHNAKIAGDDDFQADIFLRDLVAGTTVHVSRPIYTGQSGDSKHAAISGDGSHVAFGSRDNRFVSGDTNGKWDVFVRNV